MHMSSSSSSAPSSRQLRYLRALADKTGTTFTYPVTRAEASCEIRALQARNREPRVPWHTVDDGDATTYATAVDASEVDGYGSSARWRGARRDNR
jgi:hypothetical protein